MARDKSRFSISLLVRLLTVTGILGGGTYAVIQSQGLVDPKENDSEVASVDSSDLAEFHKTHFIGALDDKPQEDENPAQLKPEALLTNRPEVNKAAFQGKNDDRNIGAFKLPDTDSSSASASFSRQKTSTSLKMKPDPEFSKGSTAIPKQPAQPAASRPTMPKLVSSIPNSKTEMPKPSLGIKLPVDDPKPTKPSLSSQLTMKSSPDITPSPSVPSMARPNPNGGSGFRMTKSLNSDTELPPLRPKVTPSIAQSSPPARPEVQKIPEVQIRPPSQPIRDQIPGKTELNSNFAMKNRPSSNFGENIPKKPEAFKQPAAAPQTITRPPIRKIAGSSLQDPNSGFTSNSEGGDTSTIDMSPKPNLPTSPTQPPARNIGSTLSQLRNPDFSNDGSNQNLANPQSPNNNSGSIAKSSGSPERASPTIRSQTNPQNSLLAQSELRQPSFGGPSAQDQRNTPRPPNLNLQNSPGSRDRFNGSPNSLAGQPSQSGRGFPVNKTSSTPNRLTQPASIPGQESTLLASATSPAVQSSGQPGERVLEGVQTPSISLQKQAPREVQVGRPATFKLSVRNVGRVTAYGVTVVDQIPRGTRLSGSQPKPTTNTGEKLVWNLGTMQPGESKEISLELIPQTTGEIGSVAQVSFQARAAVRTISTKPQLQIQHSGPKKALIGQDVFLRINVKNIGDGAANNVIIEEDVPAELYHPESQGRSLEYALGTLAPNESREVNLRLKAVKAGMAINKVSAKGLGGLTANDQVQFEVVAPKVALGIKGPSRRYLERLASYTLTIQNNGTAPATNVNMMAKLPRGFKFVRTDNNGVYNARTHSVYWSLVSLPPESQGVVNLKVLPIDTGTQKIEYQTTADLNIKESTSLDVGVEQLAELFFDVDDTADPIEVGSQTVYQVRVVNQGSKAATNVRVQIRMPDSISPVTSEGPTKGTAAGRVVTFAPLPRLAPSAEATYRIQARGDREGVHRIQVSLSSDERKEPVSKEESTEVYNENR